MAAWLSQRLVHAVLTAAESVSRSSDYRVIFGSTQLIAPTINQSINQWCWQTQAHLSLCGRIVLKTLVLVVYKSIKLRSISDTTGSNARRRPSRRTSAAAAAYYTGLFSVRFFSKYVQSFSTTLVGICIITTVHWCCFYWPTLYSRMS